MKIHSHQEVGGRDFYVINLGLTARTRLDDFIPFRFSFGGGGGSGHRPDDGHVPARGRALPQMKALKPVENLYYLKAGRCATRPGRSFIRIFMFKSRYFNEWFTQPGIIWNTG